MKTSHRHRFLLSTILVPALALGACSPATSFSWATSPDVAGETPEDVVDHFYAWAINWEYDPDQNAPRQPEGEYYLRPEVAPELVYHVERTLASFGDKGGYSPILCAQDIPESVTVGEASISGDNAELLVSTSFGTEFTVALAMWQGKWRIRDIDCRLG